jgi:hypothetical protein
MNRKCYKSVISEVLLGRVWLNTRQICPLCHMQNDASGNFVTTCVEKRGKRLDSQIT